MPWNLKWHIAIALAFLLALGVLTHAQAAQPSNAMHWAGGTWPWPWIGSRTENSVACFGEDSYNEAFLFGDLAPGEYSQAALPNICDYGGGGAALFVSGYAKGNVQLVARIVRPDGAVITHNDGKVCLSDTIWTSYPGVLQPIGVGGLTAGVYSLQIQNVGARLARNVSVQYLLNMGDIMEGICPAGDILVDGH
jgi:hypothetical protein